MLGDSEGLEVVAVVCCCLVISLDRLSGFLLFAIHSALPWLPSARLSPSRQAPGPFQRYCKRPHACRFLTAGDLLWRIAITSP